MTEWPCTNWGAACGQPIGNTLFSTLGDTQRGGKRTTPHTGRCMGSGVWRFAAKCRGTDPSIFDEGGREAEQMCNQCTVQAECAADALQPINVSSILRNVLDTELDEPEDVVYQSGVYRAGVQM